MRIPAETFPPGAVILEEIIERNWSTDELARRMGGDAAVNKLCIDMLILNPSRDVVLDVATAEGLERAFGVSAEFFLKLDEHWRAGGSSEGV